VSIAEIDGIDDVDGAAEIVACDPEAETDGVYEFVTVFLTKLSVEVWEEVVECVEVRVLELETRGDLERVGEADCVLETEADAEIVLVLYIVLVSIGEVERVLRDVDVLDMELEPELVEELISDFESMELKEFVSVWTWDLDALGEPEYEAVWEDDGVNVGVTVGMGIDVNFPDDVNVAELHDEIIAVLEAVAEIDADLVTIDDADDVAVCVCVLETCIEDVTVAVWNLGVDELLIEYVMVGEEDCVLLALPEAVWFDELVDDAVTGALALLDFEPILDAERLGVVVAVLDDIVVLDVEEEPVDVFDLIIVVVPVIDDCLVNVKRGERDCELEPVDVLEARIDEVSVGDEDVVLDWGGDLV